MPTRLGRCSRLVLYALHVAAIIAVGLTAIRYLDRPLRADEVDLAIQVKGILAHGVPKVLFSEDRTQHVQGYFGYDARYGMLHPPLYYYALTLAVAVLGDHNWSYRIVGLLCLIGSIGVLARLARDLLGRDVPRLCVAIPLSLAVLSPLVTEGSLFLDIDNTTLLLSMVYLLYRFFRPGDPYSNRRTIELALCLTLTLCSKLTTPFLLMASLALYAALGRSPVRGVVRVVLASAAAVASFAALYSLYCWALSYPPRFMFDVTYVGKRDLYDSISALRNALFAARWYFVWWSPIPVVLFVSLTLRRLKRLLRHRDVEPLDLLVIFANLIFLVYIIVGALWGKYALPGAFVGAAAVGIDLASVWPRLQWRVNAGLGVAVGALAIAALKLPVPYMRTSAFDPRGAVGMLAVDPRNLSAIAMTALALVCAVVIARWSIRGETRVHALDAGMVICLAISVPITIARVVLPTDDRGPFRPSHDKGFMAVAAYLDRTNPPNETVLAPKDLGYYFNGRSYSLETLLSMSPALAHEVALRPDVGRIVDSIKFPVIFNPHFFDGVPIERIDDIDDYRVYVKR